jgi:hypothetical protein
MPIKPIDRVHQLFEVGETARFVALLESHDGEIRAVGFGIVFTSVTSRGDAMRSSASIPDLVTEAAA